MWNFILLTTPSSDSLTILHEPYETLTLRYAFTGSITSSPYVTTSCISLVGLTTPSVHVIKARRLFPEVLSAVMRTSLVGAFVALMVSLFPLFENVRPEAEKSYFESTPFESVNVVVYLLPSHVSSTVCAVADDFAVKLGVFL